MPCAYPISHGSPWAMTSGTPCHELALVLSGFSCVIETVFQKCVAVAFKFGILKTQSLPYAAFPLQVFPRVVGIKQSVLGPRAIDLLARLCVCSLCVLELLQSDLGGLAG